MSEIVSTNWSGPITKAENGQWHTIDREPGTNPKLAAAIVATVRDIEQRQISITDGNRRNARLYCGYTPIGLTWGNGPGINVRHPFEATRNIARGICDTATSLIVKNRPKSTFVTDGADFEIQMQAEDMDQFVMGQFELSNIYQVAPRSFLDSTIFGTGGWKYVPVGDGKYWHIETERVLIDDIVIDEDECRTGLQPDNIYHRVIVRTDALINKYAKGDSAKAREIRYRLSASSDSNGWPTRYVPAGRSVLIEAIYIDPFGSNDARRVVCVDNCVLSDTIWPFDFFPYTFLWWSVPVSGFYGDGVCYRQYGRQQRITYLYRWIQHVQDLYGTPRAWIDPSGGPPVHQLTTEIGAVIQARKPPTFQIQNPVPSDTYKWLDALERGGYEDEGMSNVTGSGYLPPGVDSAPAQREWNFRETQKFAPVSQRWEHAIAVEAAEKIIEMCRHHVKTSGTKPKVSWVSDNKMYTVKFPDLKKDAYIIRPEASSLDSLSPAARVQSALELSQTGWITPQEGRALISHPDLRESDQLGNSGETYAKWVLWKLQKGEQLAVDEKTDLIALDRVVRQGRALAITRNAPQGIIDNMSRFLDDLDAIKLQMQASLAMGAPQLGPPPQGPVQSPVPINPAPNHP